MAKKITIQDIAESANVSKSTVSRVLNNNTPVAEAKRKAVLAAMERLNFKPNILARSLAGGNSMTLGIVTQNIGSPFYDSVTQGVINQLSDTDYSPIFADGQWDPVRELASLKTLLDRNVDGLVMVGGTLEPDQMLELCDDKPIVVVARRVEAWADRCVSIDNVEAAKEATEHLIKAGHSRIGHIMGIEEHQDARDRFEGYKAALAEAGIEYDPNLVANGNFSSQSGVIAVESLLVRNITFSALFCANDEMASGARLTLYRRGIRVPEDVSIVGFDDQPSSAFMTPPLTTVAQPAVDMGAAAASILLALLKKKEYTIPTLEAKLVVRESVKRLILANGSE